MSSLVSALRDADIRIPTDLPPVGEYLAVTYRYTTRQIVKTEKAGDFIGALRKLDAQPWIRKSVKERKLELPTELERAKVSSLIRYVTFFPFEQITEQPWASFYLSQIMASAPGSRFLLGWAALPPAQDEAYAVLLAQPRGFAGPKARALIAAISVNDIPRALTLIAPARHELDAPDAKGATALHHAVAARSVELVERLLAAGANPNAFAAYGNAPLFSARWRRTVGPFANRVDDERHFEVLRLLADAGADATVIAGTYNIISLLDATPNAPNAWVDYWLAKGAKPLALSSPRPLANALTTVHYGEDANTIHRGAQAFRTLLRAGADPNERDDRYTVLHLLLGETTGFPDHSYPARIELLPTLRAMLDAGAREEPGLDGVYPGDFAIGWGYDEVIPLLSKFSSHALRSASRKGFRASVEWLLARGLDANDADPITRETALHVAADWGQLEIARRLLAAGADPTRKDRRGRTPRDLAVAARHAKVAILLVRVESD